MLKVLNLVAFESDPVIHPIDRCGNNGHNSASYLVPIGDKIMEQLLANRSVSITELKRSPSAIIEQAGDEAVAVLNHNRPAAYLVQHGNRFIARLLDNSAGAAFKFGDANRAISQ